MELLNTDDYYGIVVNECRLSLILSEQEVQRLWRKSIVDIVLKHIGTFPTPERALEELDRIHDWIALSNGVGVYQVSKP